MFFKKREKQIIHLYTICWNEEYMLPYFFKHYDKFVDKYVFFDDGSTDKTIELLSSHPNVEIRTLPRLDNDSYVLAAKEIHNNCWKESRGIADWVIYTAVDEFLYVSNLKRYLRKCSKTGVTVIPALGYQMISAVLPIGNSTLLNQVKTGCSWSDMNKLSILNPNKISETGHAVGRHKSLPIGNVVYPKNDILLNLHYKYLNFETTFKRHAALQEKLGVVDKENHWGTQYGWPLKKFKEDWDYFESRAVENIFSIWYNPSEEHSKIIDRWWRQEVK